VIASKSKQYKPDKTIEEKNQEMKAIIQTLEDGVRDVFDSEKYKSFLQMCGKFHQYSFNNVLLILSQCSKAQFCASYSTWKSMKMPVKKGEKGLRILCPVTYQFEKKNRLRNKVKNIEEENKKEDENEAVLERSVRFRVGHVFDISQVEGELPVIANELTDNPEYLIKVIEDLIKTSPIPIKYDASLRRGGSNGYYDIVLKEIALRNNMNSMQTFKTLIHEIAHSILHSNGIEKYTREEAEVQAESTAFVVCSSLGLDTSEYSFTYIATWSKGKELTELKNSLSAIEKASKDILDRIATFTELKLTA